MILNTRFWLKISLLNLLIVAFLGMVMRYKIGFEFPYFDQKSIQHAHSHFAFLGWITHTIYVLILHVMVKHKLSLNEKRYRLMIVANLLCSYGMIFSFISSGYGIVSIVISTIAIFVNYAFCYYLYRDLKNLSALNGSANWFRAGLFFNAISSLGTFSLAYMMATKQFNQNWYLASVYFYLHFQYNGFFTFTCLGLLASQLNEWLPTFKSNKAAFWLMFLSCVPAYFLSTLWAGLPVWLYVFVVIASFAQLFGWLKLVVAIKNALPSKTSAFKNGYYLFLLVAIAFSAKLLLQLGSTIPALSKLAFGFRPVVIAYLHLILLAVISVFLLTYIYTLQLINTTLQTKLALYLFVGGVFANEILLAIQGIASFSYTSVPFGNELLFAIAVLIFSGIGLLYFFQRRRYFLALEP